MSAVAQEVVKKCGKCGEVKGAGEFTLRGCHCKACTKEYNRRYHQANLEKLREKDRRYHAANREKRAEYNRAYREANRERLLEAQQQHYQENQERMREKRRIYREANREKVCEGLRQYYQVNREKLLKEKQHYSRMSRDRISSYMRSKYEADPSYRATAIFRARFRRWFKAHGLQKDERVMAAVGLHPLALVAYIQAQFQPGMTWENHGPVWHIDHKIPLASAGDDVEAMLKLWHYSNLQPLWAEENLSKGAKTGGET